MVAGEDDDGTIAVSCYRTLQHHPAFKPRAPLAYDNTVELYGAQQFCPFREIGARPHFKPAIVQHPSIVISISRVFVDQKDSGPVEDILRSGYALLPSRRLHLQPLSDWSWTWSPVLKRPVGFWRLAVKEFLFSPREPNGAENRLLVGRPSFANSREHAG